MLAIVVLLVYCVTINTAIRQYIFKRSLQVTVAGVLPHVTRAPTDRVARLASFTPNFTNLAFLEAVGVKKLLGVFFQYLAFSGGSWHMLSDWCFGFLSILLKSVIRLF